MFRAQGCFERAWADFTEAARLSRQTGAHRFQSLAVGSLARVGRDGPAAAEAAGPGASSSTASAALTSRSSPQPA